MIPKRIQKKIKTRYRTKQRSTSGDHVLSSPGLRKRKSQLGRSNSDFLVKPEPAQASKSRLNSLAPVRGEVLTNALMHLVLLCLCLKVSLCHRKSLMNFIYLHCPFVGGLCMRNKITKANFCQTNNGKIN